MFTLENYFKITSFSSTPVTSVNTTSLAEVVNAMMIIITPTAKAIEVTDAFI